MIWIITVLNEVFQGKTKLVTNPVLPISDLDSEVATFITPMDHPPTIFKEVVPISNGKEIIVVS